MPRSSFKVFETLYPYLVTCSILDWIPIFSKPDAVEVILDSLEFHQQHRKLRLYGYVVMENHIHLVVQSDQLPKNMRTFKSYTARQIIDLLKQKESRFYLHKLNEQKLTHHRDADFQFWQEGYHPKQIVGDDMMIQKLEYVHNNPVKRGYVDKQEHWRYSSAANYVGKEGLIPITLYRR